MTKDELLHEVYIRDCLLSALDTNVDSDRDELMFLWRSGEWREIYSTWKSVWGEYELPERLT